MLTKASKLSKKNDQSQTSKGRGRFSQRGRGRGRGRHQKEEHEEVEKKPFDKSKIKCYNCQKMGHFADECQFEKKEKGKDEKVNIAEEFEEKSTSMILSNNEFSERLLHGNGEEVNCELWFLETGEGSHMTCIKSFFHSIDEHKTGNVKFGDGSCWDLRLEKLSKSSSKIMISVEGVESKHSTELKNQE